MTLDIDELQRLPEVRHDGAPLHRCVTVTTGASWCKDETSSVIWTLARDEAE